MEILFVQTGGTIDKDYPRVSKGWAFEIHDPAFLRILERLNPTFDYKVVAAMKKDSLEITQTDRIKLRQLIEASDTDKIVITHGTDTMLETGTELASISNKTIVITGSMRPERFSNSDADVNFGMAIGVVQTVASGVYLCMHGNVIPIEQATRNLTTGQYHFK